ncbi:S-adenosyl-L-methionine-dependent methyltransferase [Xylariomycetidae sp. FL2044]|nr:S-adenosyl-L-methionine-dependent methyltransferase [Xylariomycetidae sp. FL2044]
MAGVDTVAKDGPHGAVVGAGEKAPSLLGRQSSTMSVGDGNLPSTSSSKVELSPVEETLLMVLYLRVRDAASPNPILGDVYAQQVINKVDCDFSRSLFTLDDRYVKYIAGRSKQIDVWCQDFIDAHDKVTVLHLACGLDSRNLRINRTADVRWIDVDRPQVTSLRERLMASPPGDYQLITASIMEEDAWLKEIPKDRPTLIIAEGLSMYLDPDQGPLLFQRLLNHLSGVEGQIAMDTIGSVTVMFTKLLEAFRQSKARVTWGIDNARDIEVLDKRIKRRERIYLHDFMETGPFGKNGVPLFGRWTPLISLLPKFKKNGMFLLFDYSSSGDDAPS